MRSHLRAVKDEAPRIDICALNRADIAERDWSAVMIAGDKAPAIALPDLRKRMWRR
jgi:hypothetical protein